MGLGFSRLGAAGKGKFSAGVPAAKPSGFVMDGDSITAGQGVSVAYAKYFMTLTGVCAATSVAVSGQRLAAMDTNYAANVAPLFNTTRSSVAIMGGTNDIGFDGATDLTLRTYIQSYAAKARATGFKIYPITILSRNDASWNGTKEGYRAAFNSWLKANFASFADGVIDLDSVPESQDPSNLTYYQDGLHPTDALDRLLAAKMQSTFGYVTQVLAFTTTPIVGTGTVSDSNRVSLTSSATATFITPPAIIGKKVFGLTLDVAPGAFAVMGIGIGSAAAAIGMDGSKSIGYFSNGGVFLNSANIAGGAVSYTAGNATSTVGFVIDQTNNKAWVTSGTNDIYTGTVASLTKAQVEAGTSGFNIAAITALGSIFPMAGSQTTLGQKWRVSAFPGDIPIGYTSLNV